MITDSTHPLEFLKPVISRICKYRIDAPGRVLLGELDSQEDGNHFGSVSGGAAESNDSRSPAVKRRSFTVMPR